MAVLGTATVKIEPELSNVFAIVIAAVKLHDALYYVDNDTLDRMAPHTADIFVELQHAIQGRPTAEPAPDNSWVTRTKR